MAVITRANFKEWHEEQKLTLVGTCAYRPCSRPVYALDRQEKTEDKVYHGDCFQMELDDKLSAHIDEHPIISHGIRRHTLVEAMGDLD